MQSLLVLAHLSDLHFSHLEWGLSQFFSKRWIGNVNLFFKRKRTFVPEALTSLIPLLHEQKVDVVLITGDLSSTSHEKEFALAEAFIENLRQENFKVFLLPGNHDQYTKKAFRQKLFYQFFDKFAASDLPFSLKEDGLTASHLGHSWWLITLDTAIATSLLSSNGYFSPQLEDKLERALEQIPADHQVILSNHFPLFANESARKSLIRREALRQVIERFPKIRLFLHGHSHRHTIADLRSSNLPIILDSGSTAHIHQGSWNLLHLASQGCELDVFKKQTPEAWQISTKSTFKW